MSTTDHIVRLGGLADPIFEDAVSWWGRASSFEHIATHTSQAVPIEISGAEHIIQTASVSSSFFSALGLESLLGRTLLPEDEKAESIRVAILSHKLWRSHFGTNSAVLGNHVYLNRVQYTIVGIMPIGMTYPPGTELWIARTAGARGIVSKVQTSERMAIVTGSTEWIGSLRKGSSVEGARGELYALLKRLHELYSAKTGIHYGDTITVTGLSKYLGDKYRAGLMMYLMGSGLFLLVACLNSGMYVMGIAMARLGENAVRQVVGARPGHICLRAVYEGGVLSCIVGLLGYGFAQVALNSLETYLRLFSIYLPEESTATMLSFGISMGISLVVVTVAFGYPTMRSVSPELMKTLVSQGGALTGGQGQVFRKAVIAIEVALAFALTTAAIVAVRTLIGLTSVDLGYNPKHVVTAKVRARLGKGTVSSTQQELLSQLGSVPGVKAVGYVDKLPIPWQGKSILFVGEVESSVQCAVSIIGGEYFQVLEMPVVSGQRSGSPRGHSVIVNREAVTRIWNGRNPIGEMLQFQGEPLPREVVAVVQDSSSKPSSEERSLQCYLPYENPYRGRVVDSEYHVVARLDPRADEAVSSLYGQLRAASSGVFPYGINEMEDLLQRELAPARWMSFILTTYAAAGIGVALFGIYALIAYYAVTRRAEIGVRMAIGAEPLDVAVLMVGEVLFATGCGILIGSVASLGVMKTMESLFYGVIQIDPESMAVAGLIISASAALACIIPVCQLTRRHPWVLLREER